MEPLRYLDFDLLIERSQDHYRARVLASPAGQASTDFVLPFTDQDLEILMLRVGRPRRGVRRLESPEMQAAKQFGGKLFDTVFAGEVRGALRSSIDAANREGNGLRLRLRLGDAPELVDLPWEFLYNSSLNRFLTLSNKTPLVRYIELPETPRPLRVTPPLRILVMISSPTDYDALDVEREWQKLNDALREPMARNLITLERIDTATLSALRQKLRQEQYHILHFIGHGDFDVQQQDGVLLLEDEQHHGRRASGQYLAPILTDHSSLRLVVLNACEGGRSARTDPFAGVASSLIQQGIPAVIAMQFEITDEASITFAHELYAALADGYPVDAAVSEARGAIFADVNDLEWGTPVLYLRAPDGMIFDVRGAPAPVTVAPAPVIIPNTPLPVEPETVGTAPPRATTGKGIPRTALALGALAVLALFLFGGAYALGVFSPTTPTPTPTVPVGGFTPPTVPAKGGLIVPPVVEKGSTPASATVRGTVQLRGKDNAPMLLVPEGEFTMGSSVNDDADEDERPLHTVQLSAFWIDQHEVTNGQYSQCVAAGACQPPAGWNSATRGAYYGIVTFDDYPVVGVTWNDAASYCGWAGGYLPTEAEWEKAARGTEGLIYPWGNDFDPQRVNTGDIVGDTTESGSYPMGASPYGVFDIAGNVWEWVADRYAADYYATSPRENPRGPETGDTRVRRGGSYATFPPNVRTAERDSADPTYSDLQTGFRCATFSTFG